MSAHAKYPQSNRKARLEAAPTAKAGCCVRRKRAGSSGAVEGPQARAALWILFPRACFAISSVNKAHQPSLRHFLSCVGEKFTVAENGPSRSCPFPGSAGTGECTCLCPCPQHCGEMGGWLFTSALPVCLSALVSEPGATGNGTLILSWHGNRAHVPPLLLLPFSTLSSPLLPALHPSQLDTLRVQARMCWFTSWNALSGVYEGFSPNAAICFWALKVSQRRENEALIPKWGWGRTLAAQSLCSVLFTSAGTAKLQ